MDPNYVQQTKKVFPDLTKGLKKVADYLLSEQMMFAIHPAKKVGNIIGVSETMVIRFCHTIGYNGYSQLQKDVRSHLLQFRQETGGEAATNGPAPKRFTKQMQDDITILRSNIDSMEEEKMEAAVKAITESDKVIIAGYYHSFAFAHWFYFNLNYVLGGNASLYRPENDAGLIHLLPEKSCIVIFSFYRYAMDTIQLAKEAKGRKITVISITDSRVAPVAEFSDIVIPVKISPHAILNKGPITLSIINEILYEITLRVEKKGTIQSSYKYFIKDGEV